MTDFRIKLGTPQISIADHATDYAPAAANTMEIGTPNDVQIDMTSLADGSYRQWAKFDFETPRSKAYRVSAALEFAATPVVGDLVILIFGFSDQTTAANGNPGGFSGSDAAYTGYATGTAAESTAGLLTVPLVVTDDATAVVQIFDGGIIRPTARYCVGAVFNDSGAALHSDMVESGIFLTPITDTDDA